MGFGGAEVGDVLKSSFGGGGWQYKPQEGSAVLMGKKGWGSAVLKLCYWVL